MIHLHRLNGQETVVNAELIESIESHGTETVLSLVTGNKIVVLESTADVVQKTVAYKKTVFAGAAYLPEFLKGDKPEGGNKPCHSHS